jgi:ligand-binding sensor domain-containing protein
VALKHLRFVCSVVNLLLLSLGGGFVAFAQPYQVDIEPIGLEQGLLHREVNAIYQDSRGLVWIATPLGINRYDGYRIKWFTKQTHGLPTNDFGLITEDQKGRIWFLEREPWESILFFKQ